MDVSLILAPLVMQGRVRLWRETAYYIIPPGASTTVRLMPRDRDRVIRVFKLTLGRPRDYDTGLVLYTDEVFFWYRSREVMWHYIPLTESVVGYDYPHIATATVGNPIEIMIENRSSITVIVDLTLWLMEYGAADARLVDEYVSGVVNFFRLFSRVERLEDLARFVPVYKPPVPITR